jgi:hypothetical protein
MPSTHLSLHYHIVFSTTERRRIIADNWRDDLHAYIGGIVKDMDAIPDYEEEYLELLRLSGVQFDERYMW